MQLNVRIDDDVLRRFKCICINRGVTLSDAVERLIHRDLDESKSKETIHDLPLRDSLTSEYEQRKAVYGDTEWTKLSKTGQSSSESFIANVRRKFQL